MESQHVSTKTSQVDTDWRDGISGVNISFLDLFRLFIFLFLVHRFNSINLFAQHAVLILIANVAAVSLHPGRFTHPFDTNATFPNQDVNQGPKRLFTPSEDGQYTLPRLKSLQNYETEVQRSVDYPARGTSTYYYYAPNRIIFDDEPSIDEKSVSSIPRHITETVSIIHSDYQMEHTEDFEKQNILPQNIYNPAIDHLLASDLSHTSFEGPNVKYSW